MGSGLLRVGTSGYSYKEWKPAFYPADLSATRFLEYYAARFSTVEINNTFYRFPAQSMLDAWNAQTPPGFTFAFKAPQQITHKARLKNVAGDARDLVERCLTLREKLGPILFQLPPSMKRDDARLDGFLTELPPVARYAMEFRHASWFHEAVFERLTRASVAFCVSEGDKIDAPRVATSDFCYVRLRRETYDDATLADWRAWIDQQRAAGRDVFAYLKHDDKGESPERALKLLASA